MKKYEDATHQEITDYVHQHYGDMSVNSLSVSEKNNLAGEIAQALGKRVRANGLGFVPDSRSTAEKRTDSFLSALFAPVAYVVEKIGFAGCFSSIIFICIVLWAMLFYLPK